MDDSLEPHVVDLDVRELSTTNFRRSGGETLTIRGSHFPASMDTEDEVSVTFSDGTQCVIQSVTSEEISCKVQPFQPDRREGRRLET